MSQRHEIKDWTRRHVSQVTYECEACGCTIDWQPHRRIVYRVENRRATRNYTTLEVVREHVCCPVQRRS